MSVVCFHQEVLRWIQDVVADIGSEVTLDQLKDYIHKTLKSGRVLQIFIVYPEILIVVIFVNM